MGGALLPGKKEAAQGGGFAARVVRRSVSVVAVVAMSTVDHRVPAAVTAHDDGATRMPPAVPTGRAAPAVAAPVGVAAPVPPRPMPTGRVPAVPVAHVNELHLLNHVEFVHDAVHLSRGRCGRGDRYG